MAFSCAALLLSACARRSDFGSWGLPADLDKYLGQLEDLKVPAAVTRLDWIPRNLKGLDASNTAVTAIPYLPAGLERLNASKAKDLALIPGLPPFLRELDISFTAIDGPWNFPQSLESLALGGSRVVSLEGLNSTLLDLTLDKVESLKSFTGLPPSLRSLSISDSPFADSIGLPRNLQELSLTNTPIQNLKAMPLSLRRLTLKHNQEMEVEFPAFLLSLTLVGRQRKLSPLRDLAFLSHLYLEPASLEAWPTKSLRVVRAPAAFLREGVIPSLRRMEIVGAYAQFLPELPQNLRELEWAGGCCLASLPEKLSHLSIRGSPLSTLEGLRANLSGLDVSETSMRAEELPGTLQDLTFNFYQYPIIRRLPESLRRLDLSGSAELEVVRMLPPRLERLNLSGTRVVQLPQLPPSLRELDISNTPIRGVSSLNEGLLSLTVHSGQLHSLAGLPRSVKKLYFVEAAQ